MEHMEIELKKVRKSMIITRVFCVIPAILFAVIIVGGVYIWGQISEIVDNVMPTVEALNNTLGNINTDELNDAVKNLNDAADAIRKVTSIFK